VSGLPSGDLREPLASELQCDVAVVGAGPAGGATALLAARAGLDTWLIERSPWPREKVCGCCLHPRGLAALRALDPSLSAAELGALPLHSAWIAARGGSARLPTAGAAVLSRTRLDGRLVELARAAGARFEAATRAALEPPLPGAERRRLTLHGRDGGRTTLAARLVVAADGLGGALLAHSGEVSAPPRRGARVGLGAVLPASAGDWPAGTVGLAVVRSGYAGLVRLEDGRLDLAAAVDPRALHGTSAARWVAAALAEAGFPALDGLESTVWRGTPALQRHPRRPFGQRALAVGDAAGYVEPFTGEGLAWALDSAVRLGPALGELVAAFAPPLVRRLQESEQRALGSRRRRCAAVARFVRHPRWVAAAALLARRSHFLATALARVGYGPSPR
jgi:flavin-dependent dehydrogenase